MTFTKNSRNFLPEISAFLLTAFILIPPQLVIKKYDMLLLERFFLGGGWLQIIVLACYAAFLVHHMKNGNTAKWRIRAWTIFNIWFFAQLCLGIFSDSIFLLSGKLHFPIPTLIIAGPVYRWQMGFMPFLFLSTILIAGPAWCSQLCYWGAMDQQLASQGKPQKNALPNKKIIRNSFLILIVLIAIGLRLFKVSNYYASIVALAAGIVGIGIMLIFSRKQNKMIHCISYCPVGTLTSYIKYVNPFRMYIENSTCTNCMACIPSCRYDALNKEDILNRTPGLTCTYCGDCVSACKDSSIKYKLFSFTPENARLIWIVLTIALHAAFMGLGRI